MGCPQSNNFGFGVSSVRVNAVRDISVRVSSVPDNSVPNNSVQPIQSQITMISILGHQEGDAVNLGFGIADAKEIRDDFVKIKFFVYNYL